jgi:hypothetical protein
MNNFTIRILSVLIPFLFCSCADQIVSECDNQDGLRATLSSIQQSVFTPACALSGCHGGSSPQENLDLSAGNSRNGLVNITSTEDGVMKRVEPGNSEQSWLMKKLNGDGTSVMPTTGKLSQATIDTIAAWINAGALDN